MSNEKTLHRLTTGPLTGNGYGGHSAGCSHTEKTSNDTSTCAKAQAAKMREESKAKEIKPEPCKYDLGASLNIEIEKRAIASKNMSEIDVTASKDIDYTLE